MSFLTAREINILLELLNGDDRKATLLYLATGGRWGESGNFKDNKL